jgi:hypothetical protein
VAKPLAFYRLHDSNLNYQGAAADFGRRFAKRVSLRMSELAHLREHAERRAIALPSGNLLDHDLTFVNYRLMLKRLGAAYEGSASDKAARLWRAGMSALRQRPLPLRLKAAHALWLTSLSCSPRWLVKRLVAARFGRGAPIQPLRRKLLPLPSGTGSADDRAARQSA